MTLFVTEFWTIPPIPPEGGAFPFFSWGIAGEHSYPSETWDSPPFRFTEVEITPGDRWCIQCESNTEYLGDEGICTYTYVISNFDPAGFLRIDFTQLDAGFPVRQVQLQINLFAYGYRKVRVAPLSLECSWEEVEFSEDNYYTGTLFKIPPYGRRCLFVRFSSPFLVKFPWEGLKLVSLDSLLPGIILPQ